MRRTYDIHILALCLCLLLLVPNIQGVNKGGRGYIEITEPEISIDVSNSFATYRVKFTLENNGEDDRETHIGFDIPEDAFLTNLTVDYNETKYYGKVKEAEQAEEEYQQAVSQGKTAVKLEKYSVNRFGMTLNLEPERPLKVKYVFNKFIVKELGGYDVSVVPVDLLPEEDLDAISLKMDIESPTTITAVDPINLDDDVPEYHGTKGLSIDTSISSNISNKRTGLVFKAATTRINGTMNFHKGEEVTYFVHTFAPGIAELGNDKLKKDIVFIVDRSGSMSGNKMEQTKKAFDVIVDQLSPEYDRFNIISFSDEISPWKEELQLPNNDSVSRAKDHIDGLIAGGSTNIIESLESGLDMFGEEEDRMKIVVFLTDGNPTAGYIESPPAICEQVQKVNARKVSVFSLGIGYDMDFNFLKKLSFTNYARAYRIDDKKDISEQITDFYDTISTPLIFDLELEYDNAREVYHRQAPYLFLGQEHCVVGKVKDTGKDVGFRGSGVTVDDRTDISGAFSVSDSADPSVETFWAYMHIKWCEEKIVVGNDTDVYERELTDTAVEHGIVTEYTTMLVVVEEEKEEPEDAGENGEEAQGSGDGTDDLSYDDTGKVDDGGGSSNKFDYPDDDEDLSSGGDSDGRKEESKDSGAFSPLFALISFAAVALIVLGLYVKRNR